MHKKLIICLAGIFLLAFVLYAAFFCTPPANVSGLVGKWWGPEGTYMEIEVMNDGGYLIVIQDLDQVSYYPAKVDAKGLSFKRADVRERITGGTGPNTGMKWLMDKKECLIVKEGEGYCRN